MASFALTLVDKNEQEVVIIYNVASNQFYSLKGEPLVVENQERIIKEKPKPLKEIPYHIRVFTGKDCNMRCSYCLQREHREEVQNKMPMNKLVSEILRVVDNAPISTVQLWGGEPLMYFDECKKYISTFKEIEPNREYHFSTSTNGLVLKDLNIQKWILDNINGFTISWDGPGQSLRGIDPLKNKSIIKFIQKALDSNVRVCFNPVMTTSNFSILEYNKMLKSILDRDNYTLGQARALLPIDEVMAKYAVTNLDKINEYSMEISETLIYNKIPQWTFMYNNISLIWDSIGLFIKPNYCPGEKNSFLIIDQAGNLLTCANVEADTINETGYPSSLGHITQLEKGARPEFNFYNLKKERLDRCNNCFIFNLCKGGCPRISEQHMDIYCTNQMAELLPIYITLLYLMLDKRLLVKVETLKEE